MITSRICVKSSTICDSDGNYYRRARLQQVCLWNYCMQMTWSWWQRARKVCMKRLYNGSRGWKSKVWRWIQENEGNVRLQDER